MRLQGRDAGSRLFFQAGFQVQIADQPVEIVRMQTEQFGRFDIIAGGLFDGVNDDRFLRLLDSVVILRRRSDDRRATARWKRRVPRARIPNLYAVPSLRPSLRSGLGGSVAVEILILEFGPTYGFFLGGVWLSSGVV